MVLSILQNVKGNAMSKESENDEMREEYDFSEGDAGKIWKRLPSRI